MSEDLSPLEAKSQENPSSIRLVDQSLTREREIELILTAQTGSETQRKKANGELLRTHERLIRAMVSKYRRKVKIYAKEDEADLYQEAVLAFFLAIKKTNLEKATRLAPFYITYYLKPAFYHYTNQFSVTQSRSSKSPDGGARILKEVREVLKRQGGRIGNYPYSPKVVREIEEATGRPISKVMTTIEFFTQLTSSLATPVSVGAEGKETLLIHALEKTRPDMSSWDGKDAVDFDEQDILGETIEKANLTETEKRVIDGIYFKRLPYQEIIALVGLSNEGHVENIEGRAIRKLRCAAPNLVRQKKTQTGEEKEKMLRNIEGYHIEDMNGIFKISVQSLSRAGDLHSYFWKNLQKPLAISNKREGSIVGFIVSAEDGRRFAPGIKNSDITLTDLKGAASHVAMRVEEMGGAVFLKSKKTDKEVLAFLAWSPGIESGIRELYGPARPQANHEVEIIAEPASEAPSPPPKENESDQRQPHDASEPAPATAKPIQSMVDLLRAIRASFKAAAHSEKTTEDPGCSLDLPQGVRIDFDPEFVRYVESSDGATEDVKDQSPQAEGITARIKDDKKLMLAFGKATNGQVSVVEIEGVKACICRREVFEAYMDMRLLYSTAFIL